MTRPSQEDVDRALSLLDETVHPSRQLSDGDGAFMRRTLREAVKPRHVWMAYETARAFGVSDSNLRPGAMRDFDLVPEPVQELPRPTVKDPGKTVRLWDADEVEAAARRAAARRAERGAK